MMTRQDYIALARIIRDATRTATLPDRRGIVVTLDPFIDRAELVTALADYFKRDNSRFDRERFLAACEAK